MRWWSAAVVVLVNLSTGPVRAASPLAVGAPSTILIDAETGQVLREQEADTAHPPGALSRLMVVLLSLEEAALGGLQLDVPVSVSAPAAHPLPAGGRAADSSPRIPLRADKVYLLSDLLKAVLLGGVDDAAGAAAEAIAGSVGSCVELMNARASKLGMDSTHYSTIGALQPDAGAAPDTTTARDLARLAQALVRHPQVAQWASLSGLPFDQGTILLRNANQLVGAVPGVDGLQVSSSPATRNRVANYSIVATGQRGALRLIAVVVGARDSASRYAGAAELLEWGFAQYERLEIVRKGEPLNLPIRVINGSVSQLTPIAGQTFSLLRRRDEERDFQVRYQMPALLSAPLKRHEAIGEVIVEERGALIAVIPIVSPKKVIATGILSAALP